MSKVFFITGAGRGLGVDIARRALDAGHQVVATGRRPENVVKALGGEQHNLLVTDLAVDCRNFYVHGTPGKFDYGTHSDQPSFFTDTLEFFAAAT